VRQSFAVVKIGGAPGALDWVGAPRSVSLSLATQSKSKNPPDSLLSPSSATSLSSLLGHDADIMIILVDCWLAGI